MTIPASNIEPAVGAAAWPVGAQVCKGQMPASTAKPRNNTGNAHDCSCGENWNCASSFRSSDPALTYATRIPTNTNMPPKNEYSVSFIAPYSLLVEPKMAMRKYFGTITSS